ncbi:MAG: GTPase ObgE [Anaerolineales bacterium]|jgi:GTP-binding protein
MFLDEVKIHVASGRGGDGMVHFRREKYVPRGGPDGGDGGRGGDVVLRVDPKLSSLSPFRRKRHFRADDGAPGGGSNKTGRDAEDLVLYVPRGTVVKDAASDDTFGDLTEEDQVLVICQGGRGGRGNARYATSRNQAPRMAQRGEPGDELWLRLELRLIADVGIIGVPNAGKSTLLSAVSRARPKIADYPFTTLQPNLGVAELDDDTSLVLADIPGLIAGAHEGAGLGARFLRHIRRTRALIHLIDGMAEDPLADYAQVNTELALFDERLSRKAQVVAISKMDLPDVRDRWEDVRRAFEAVEIQPMAVSAVTGEGVRDLLGAAIRAVAEAEPEPVEDKALPVYQPEIDARSFEVGRDPDGTWRVKGKAIERAADMTYWEYDEAVRRFQKTLAKLGVESALKEAGATAGDSVRIGEYELEWQD